MSKDNGKIKVDKNSFDKMTAKQKPSKSKQKDPDKISDNKLIAWFQRYWYYYKAPVLIAAFFLFLAVVFVVDMVNKEEPDLRFTVITKDGVSEEYMLELATYVTDYIYDVNGDGGALIAPQTLTLKDDPQDDYEMAAYYQIMTTMVDESYVAYIVDEDVYEYLMNSDALEKLSYYGLESEEEYRLKLNDTWVMKDTAMNKNGPYYLVFKACNVDFLDDTIVQAMYEMYVDLAEDIIDGAKR